MASPLLLVQVLYLSSLMPLMWLSKHLFRPLVYAHTCLSLPTILSILPASEMLVEASELLSECSLIPFICFPNAHSNHCLFTVYLILGSHSNCSGHTFVYSFFYACSCFLNLCNFNIYLLLVRHMNSLCLRLCKLLLWSSSVICRYDLGFMDLSHQVFALYARHSILISF